MKLINKANNTTEKIISTDDIIVTNQELGTSLTDVLDEQQENINDLKSNVKWLYKYGGVGGRGGSGGGSSSKYSVVATLDGVKIGQNMIIDKTKLVHTLSIQISKPGGKIYKCHYKIEGAEKYGPLIEINGENQYKYVIETLSLTKNSAISIEVYDTENMEYTVIDGNYILDPFTISTNIVDNQGNNYSFVDSNDIYMGDAEGIGFAYKLSYNIAINAEINYEISITTDNNSANNKINEIFNENTKRGTITDKVNYILIDLHELLVNDYAGQYIINTKITVTQESESYFYYQNLFYLIPNNLYLAISTSNNDILYNESFDSIDNENIYFLNSGYQTLNIKPYNGNNLTSIISVNAIYSSSDNQSVQPLFSNVLVKVRDTYQYPIYLDSENKTLYEFTFSAIYNNETTTIKKYIYVKKADNQLKWYNTNPSILLSYKLSNVSAIGYSNILPLHSYNTKYSIDVSSNIKNSISLFDNVNFTTTAYTIMLNIGIQFNTVNDSDINIITLLNNSNTIKSINIYQNKILLGNNKSIDIYIPKEKNFNKLDSTKYHLLTLISRPVSQTKAEFICYIDGVIENAFIDSFGLASSAILTSDITCKLNKGNYSINLFELGYYTSPEQKITDADVANYYNTYTNKYNKTENSDFVSDQLAILNVAKNFKIANEGTNYELLEIPNSSYISTISKTAKIPVLILEYNKTFFSNKTYSFNDWFLYAYEEEEKSGSLAYINIPVEVYYLDNQEYKPELKVKYNNSGQQTNVPFLINIQGSSTRHFAIKNLDLTINLNSGDDVYLYSPNFKSPSEVSNNEKKKIFLPEETFTLKADMSDSSHCNNTSIGAFVNDNTTPFDDARKDISDQYRDYIKNCLLGFPVILIFKEIDGTDETTAKFYYIGIYNFNLGRKSYFNLGYKPIPSDKDLFNENINTSTESEIKIFKISSEHDNQLKRSLCVAEIQGNRNEFDFSQFDNSMLFGSNFGVVDKARMYDDIVVGTNVLDDAHKSIAKFTEGISYLGGFIFKFIGKTFGEDDSSIDASHGYTEGYNAHEEGDIYKSINQVPNFQWQAVKVNNNGELDIVFNKKLDLDQNDPEMSINDPNFVWKDTILQTIQNFYMGKVSSDDDTVRNSDNRGIDLVSLVEYYTVCMGFGLVDSVMKNLNIKTWTLNNAVSNPDKQDKYYIAFYDMDTALGRSNKGSSTKYFAFSDYYYTNQYEQNGLIVSQDNKIYRDFFPVSTSGQSLDGFDVPSSYLFAIAKYQALLNENYYKSITSAKNGPDGTDNITPLAIWSNFRKSGGPLESASTFIKNYFNKDLRNVPPVLLSYNYRSKYLRKANESNVAVFDNYNLTPLHGTGVYSVEDWLSGRLHILDMYFNVMGRDISIDKYDSGSWSQVTYSNSGLYEIKSVKNGPSLGINTDVVILQSMFAQNAQNQYTTYPGAKNISANVKSQYLAPTIIKGGATDLGKSYLFMDESKYMKIDYTTRGDDAVGFYGSVLWTDVSDLSDFIDRNNNLIINSNYLQNIIMKKTNALCKSLILNNIVSVKTIVIEGEQHEFTLELPSNAANIINLDKIDIHNTKIYIETLKDLNISELNMSGVKLNTTDPKNISIMSCNNLSNVNISGLKCTSLKVSPVWSNNIVLDGVDCEEITLSNTRFDNASIKISNCSNLTKLSLTGFENINIDNCQILSTLIINETDENKLTSLSITKCNTHTTKLEEGEQYKPWTLTFNSNNCSSFELAEINSKNKITNISIEEENNAIFDLRCFTQLNTIHFGSTSKTASTKGFWAIVINQKITLNTNAFSNTSLKRIIQDINKDEPEEKKSVINIAGYSIFNNTSYNTSYFAKNNDYNTFNSFSFDSNITSLRDMFRISDNNSNGTMTLQHYNNFIGSINDTIAANIVSLENAFMGQPIRYTIDTLRNNINNEGSEYIQSLAKFTKVNSIKNLFKGTGVTCIPYFLFNDGGNYIGKNVDTIDIEDFFNAGSGQNVSYIQSNVFSNIISKIKSVIFSQSSISLFNVNGSTIDSNENIKELFYFVGKDINITTVNGLNFGGECDYTNLFKNFPGDTGDDRTLSIINSFNEGSHTNINNIGLNTKKISQIINSFNFKTSANDKVQIDTFFDWSYLISHSVNNSANIDFLSTGKNTKSFTLAKCIYDTTSDNGNGWSNLWGKLKGATTLNNIFYNTVLYTDVNTDYYELYPFKNDNTDSDSSIIFTNELFKDFSVIKVDDNNNVVSNTPLPIKLTQNTFKNLSGITTYTDMFRKCTLYCNLPINLFNKATKETINIYNTNTNTDYYDPKFGINNVSDPNWDDIPVHWNSGKYTIYTYTNEKKNIVDLSGIFANVKIVDGGKTYFEYESDYTDDIIYSELNSYYSKVEVNNIKTKDSLTYRYNRIKFGNNDSQQLPEYYQDMFGLYGDYSENPVNLGANTNSYNIPLKNDKCKHYLFTAPDLLYGCSELSCDFTNMFNNSDFEGIMPNHFMSNIKGATNFTDMFKQVTIIPNYCDTYNFVCPVKDALNDNTKYGIMKNNIFVFIPQEFNTTIDTFDKLFNFNLLIPKNDDFNKTSTNDSYNTYYIMYSNSIPNVTKLISLPDISTNKQLSINSYKFTDVAGDHLSNVISHDIKSNIKVHLGTVFNKDKLEKYINSKEENDIKNYMISYNSELRLKFDDIFDYEGFSEKDGNNGFNIFNNYNGSILINSTIAQYLYGYIISPKTTRNIYNTGFKITLITTGGPSDSTLYKDLSCYALFNNNNSSEIDQPNYDSDLYDSNQILHTDYYTFNNIFGSGANSTPTILNPWQGLKYYTYDKHSNIHSLSTWNSTEDDGPTEAEKLLKCALDYSQTLKFEQVINIPFNPNIMNDPTIENINELENNKYTFIYNNSSSSTDNTSGTNP